MCIKYVVLHVEDALYDNGGAGCRLSLQAALSISCCRSNHLADMTLSLTLFLLLLSAAHLLSHLLTTEETTGWPRKAEPMLDGDRQQRSVGSSQGNPECLEDSPEGLGASYTGRVNVTASGRTCQVWSASHPHEHAYTELGDHNYCRDPSGGFGRVWCYTTDPDVLWEPCSVPFCSPTHDCQEGNPLGVTYVGSVSVGRLGRTCQNWSTSEPHDHPFSEVGEHNHCRNPVGDPNGVWCITTDPDKLWEYCSVPICVPTVKVLDFSADTDQEPDSIGEYTSATLEAGPLPESFTICTAFMVEAWNTKFSTAGLFNMPDKLGRSWGFIYFHSASTYLQYQVKLGPVDFIRKIEAVFFPLQWSRVCLSLDSGATLILSPM